jgi:hypothetical protein
MSPISTAQGWRMLAFQVDSAFGQGTTWIARLRKRLLGDPAFNLQTLPEGLSPDDNNSLN